MGKPPPLVVFEGVDGTGKSVLSELLARWLRNSEPTIPTILASFPGRAQGTLGEMVYKLQHGWPPLDGYASSIDPIARQIMHVAAHVDQIRKTIRPVLESGAARVVLDRWWWSTYAYARFDASPDEAFDLVRFERRIWQSLPPAQVVYLRRERSLKPHEMNSVRHQRLESFYTELIEHLSQTEAVVHVIENKGGIEQMLRKVRTTLGLGVG